MTEQPISNQTQVQVPIQTQEQPSVQSSIVGIQESNTSLVERAEQAVLALKAENERREKIIEKEEWLRLKGMLGGRSEAGYQVQKTPEELAKEEAAAILRKFR